MDMFKIALFFLNTSFFACRHQLSAKSLPGNALMKNALHTKQDRETSSTFGVNKWLYERTPSWTQNQDVFHVYLIHLICDRKQWLLLVIWPQICQMHVLPTFINVYCGWLSTKGIDFRQHIDPYCLHNIEMLDCDGTRHGPPMTYASLIKLSEVSNSAEIRSNIKIDENYLKGYHWYAWSFMINRVGTSQAHEARQSLCFICHQALPCLKATDVLSTEVESQQLNLLHQN